LRVRPKGEKLGNRENEGNDQKNFPKWGGTRDVEGENGILQMSFLKGRGQPGWGVALSKPRLTAKNCTDKKQEQGIATSLRNTAAMKNRVYH